MRGGRHVGVAENTGDRGHVNAVFNRAGRKGMPRGMELDVLQIELAQQLGKVVLQVVGIQNAAGPAEKDKVGLLRDAELPEETLLLLKKDLLQDRRHYELPLRGIRFHAVETQHGFRLAGFCVIILDTANGVPDTQPVRHLIVVPPPQSADLAAAQTGIERQKDRRMVVVFVVEQILLKTGLHIVRHNHGLLCGAGLDDRQRDGIAADDVFRQCLLESDVQNDAHIPHAFSRKRTAGASVPAFRLLIEKLLQHPRRDRTDREITEFGNDVFFAVFAIVFV